MRSPSRRKSPTGRGCRSNACWPSAERGRLMLRLLVEPIVRAALAEDLGRAGDITTDAIVAADAEVTAIMAAPQPGGGAGARRAGGAAGGGGRAGRGVAPERAALNFICRMSGVATATGSLVDAI